MLAGMLDYYDEPIPGPDEGTIHVCYCFLQPIGKKALIAISVSSIVHRAHAVNDCLPH